jgi:hypothetical protein
MAEGYEVRVTEINGKVWLQQYRWVPEHGYGSSGSMQWVDVYELTALYVDVPNASHYGRLVASPEGQTQGYGSVHDPVTELRKPPSGDRSE